jgi:hypothetical protein
LSSSGESSFDRLNDLHSAAAARTGWRVVGRSDLLTIIGLTIPQNRGRRQQLAAKCNLIGAVAVGEQAVVTDAMEAVWQDVHQKAPNELTGLECHHFALAVLAIILPAKAELPVGQRNQPAIGDCNAMSVTRKMGEYLLGASEWMLGKYDPFAPAQRREILLECRRSFECREVGEELKLAGNECRVEILQK